MRRLMTITSAMSQRRSRLPRVLAAGLAALVWGANARGQEERECEIGDLGELLGLDFADVHYDIRWVEGDDDCGVPSDVIPAAVAFMVRDVLVYVHPKFIEAPPTGYGFLTPYLYSPPDFLVVFRDVDAGGKAYRDCISIDAPDHRCAEADDWNDLTFRALVGTTQHELFHAIQRHYVCTVSGRCADESAIGDTTWGKWVDEGTTECLEDRLYTQLDIKPDTAGDGFVSAGLSDPGGSLVERVYDSMLFWNYCCEQMGQDRGEPQVGIDFIRSLYEKLARDGELDIVDSVGSLDQLINSNGRESLNAFWLDHAICNYAHNLDVSALRNPDRYIIIDELPPGRSYGEVARTPVAMPSTGSGSVSEYAFQVFEAPIAGTQCLAIGFHGRSEEVLGWALVGVNAAPEPDQAAILDMGQGRDFTRTFITSGARPIDRLGAIVAGLTNAADFDFSFASGQLTVTVIRPIDTHQAHPGPASEPSRFIEVRVFVDGPEELKPDGVGPRSVKGLQPGDFTVRIGGLVATVHAAPYEGGVYRLVVQAPPQPGGDGPYDLSVSLCDGAWEDTSANSVLYGDFKINLMIVADVSGSMAFPLERPKLEAAKNVGGIYCDLVGEGDRLGVVVFNGNEADCDDDATLLEALEDATLAKRDAASNGIEELTPGGWTSIGDGLWKAQDQLDINGLPDDLHRIVLLSDGEENEGRRWDRDVGCADARSRFAALDNDTVIDVKAFGPETNETLLQDISTLTEGDFEHIEVNEGARRGSGALSTTNRLAISYVESLRRARGLERLFFTEGPLTPGTTEFDIPVTEDGIAEATFFFNVNERAANLGVELLDENGETVGPADADVYQSSTHTVYHLNAVAAQGTWTARLTIADSDEPVDFIAGLLGRQLFGTQLGLGLSQIDPGHVCSLIGMDEGLYKQGVPVTVSAVLVDSLGPLRGAGVEVTIIKPDGSRGCYPRPMLDDGTQDDGEPDDGVYGLIFTETWQSSRGGVINDDPANPNPGGTPGSYQVLVHVTGMTNRGENFQRWAHTGFHVDTALCDVDGDNLPDGWELFYGTDPFTSNAGADSDQDGLSHQGEFQFGTHPYDPDSDDDGELDSSEVAHGRCPIDPDSPLAFPLDVEVVTDLGDEGGVSILRPDANLLRFPWRSAYDQMRIYRAVDEPVDFVLLHTLVRTGEDPIPVNYYDEAVQGGTTYFYRFQAVGADGGLTRLSKIVEGTPAVGPAPLFEVNWHSLDCGGTTLALGGIYKLGGTIGQHDAGSMSGGIYILKGGFWHGGLTPPPPEPGDCDGDGDVDLTDYATFGSCLTGPSAPISFGCDCADLDGNGRVDLLDFAEFQAALTG